LKTLLALRSALAEGKLPRQLREIEAFANPDDTKLLLTATFSGFPSHAEEHVRTIRVLVPEIESLLFHDPARDRMELFGPGFLEYAVGDTKYRVGHFSFFQVNRFLVDDLQKAVTGGESGKLAIDLFAGVGLFSAPLAGGFERVIAVESNPAATRDMETNVLGLRNIEVRTASVEKYLDKYRESKPDLIALDPPRDGLEPGTAKRLATVGPARITYVSCEPPTLARDLGPLVEAGYSIADIQLLDLFPQTFHMETIVRLVRRM
jgi:23S rRNA (uracil1939-C5)-methyltransferase